MGLFQKTVRLFRLAFFSILLLSGLTAVLLAGVFFLALKDLPRVPEPLSRIIETPPTEIFAATGERILIIGGREPVPLNRVSPGFLQAVIATEDHRFWEHHGINKIRILKALWVTLFEPGKIQGASTITQQLSKNLFFSFKRSYVRKFQELFVALQIESQYTKREILETYVNQIPFGVGALGIEQASRTFFDKSAIDLNLAEAALLAGLPKSPTRYNPYLYYERAKSRQQTVLQRMVAAGYITREQADAGASQELKLRQKPAGARTGSYYLDLVIKYLEERYGPEIVYHGGLKITTTIDLPLQSLAVASLQKGLANLERDLYSPAGGKSAGVPAPETFRPQGALVVIETTTGALKALVGGRDYFESEYNRAIQNQRLPGSGFKPFLYYAAFEKLNLNPASVLVDKPVVIPVAGAKDWAPENFEKRFEGPVVLKRAFTNSINTIAAQLVELVGPQDVIKTARRCGIKSRLSPVYSVALGTSGVSPLEMASAFAVFANSGNYFEPFWVSRVEDAYGRVIDEHIVSGEKVLDKNIVYQVVDMMRGVLDEGTGSVIRRMGFDFPAAGKTGTTDGYKDAWFTGFTPTLSTSVWVGFDRDINLRTQQGGGFTGSRAAAPIWAEFMLKATEGEPYREFPIPDDIRFEQVDPVSGCRAVSLSGESVRVALRKGQRVCEADRNSNSEKFESP